MLSGSPPDERRKCRVEAISKGIYFLEENRMIALEFCSFFFALFFCLVFFQLFVYRKMVKYKMLFAVAVSLRESLFFLCR